MVYLNPALLRAAWVASWMVIRPALTCSSAARPMASPAARIQPGGEGPVEVAAVLPALDDVKQPLEDRAVTVGVFAVLTAGRCQRKVAGAHRPIHYVDDDLISQESLVLLGAG